MMFIARSRGAAPVAAGITVKLSRKTPEFLPDAAGTTDYFCIGEAEAIAALRDRGTTTVELHDGYYEDGVGGGVAIWGQGRYWEIRSDPLAVSEAVGPSGSVKSAAEGEHVEVRGAIFGV